MRSNEGYGRNVLLECAEFSLLIHKLVKCFQCEMISSGKEAFGRHLKAIHCAYGAGQLKQMNLLLMFV